MTEEEYNEIIGKVNSPNPNERLKARVNLELFPEYGCKPSTINIEDVLRKHIKEILIEQDENNNCS